MISSLHHIPSFVVYSIVLRIHSVLDSRVKNVSSSLSLTGFQLVTKNGTQFLAYIAGDIGSEGARYLSPVGAAVRGQFFPNGAWIARDTFQRLAREAGAQNKAKFIAALRKSIEPI